MHEQYGSKSTIALGICLSTLLILLIGSPIVEPNKSHGKACAATGEIDRERFETVMGTIAAGWNRGDARLAASCFAENAIYSGPPSSGSHGREALYTFFGGAKGRKHPMHMRWHNLVFDPSQQIGVGEYTFQYEKQTHGLVIVKVSNGLVRNWREYEVESALPWNQFIGDNRF